MRASGAPEGPDRVGGLGPGDGTDVGAEASGVGGDRDQVQTLREGRMLDELCATTGWHRNHARKALRLALVPRIVRPRTPRASRYGPGVIEALAFCWAVLGAPTGKRLAPIMDELVPTLRRFGELEIADEIALSMLRRPP